MDLCALGLAAGLAVGAGALYMVLLDPSRPRGDAERAWAEVGRRLRLTWRSRRQPLGPRLVGTLRGVRVDFELDTGRLTLHPEAPLIELELEEQALDAALRGRVLPEATRSALAPIARSQPPPRIAIQGGVELRWEQAPLDAEALSHAVEAAVDATRTLTGEGAR